jgi:hypothetical protein
MGNATAACDEYRRRAAACLQLAEKIDDVRDKAELHEMARLWHNLADDAQRAPETFPYPTLSPSPRNDKGR